MELSIIENPSTKIDVGKLILIIYLYQLEVVD